MVKKNTKLDVVMSDKAETYGFVAISGLTKGTKTTKVSVKLLKRVVKILGQLGTDDVYVSVNDDEVMVLREKRNSMLGLALANKLDN
jgi:hypothetical protein